MSSLTFASVSNAGSAITKRRTKHNTNCCVYGCNSRKGKERHIHFHYFPKQNSGIRVKIINSLGEEEEGMDKRKAWEKVLQMRKTATKDMRVCSKHFRKEDYCAASVELNRPKLKRFAVPSQNLPNDTICNLSLCTGQIHENNEETIKPAVIEDRSNPDWEQSLNMGVYTDGKDVRRKIEAKDEQSLEPTSIEDPLLQIKQEILEINEELCRICFESKPNLVSLFSEVLNGDETLNLIELFQYLTEENTEQIHDPRYPNQICDDCINLVINAYEFRRKYEKTLRILKEIPHLKKVEENYDSEATLSATENEEMNDEMELLEICKESDEETIENKIHNIKEILDYFLNNEKPKKRLHNCPICLKQFTAVQLKYHSRNHKELHPYFNGAPVYIKKIRFYAVPKRTYKEPHLNEHVCYFCKKKFDALKYFDHVCIRRRKNKLRSSEYIN